MSSPDALPRSSFQHPNESDDVERKLACASSNLNVGQKVAALKSDLRTTGLIKGLIITSMPHHVPDDEIQCECIIRPATKAKLFNTPGYPARIPKPPRTGLYKLGSTPDMGKGLFATRDIKRGELILADRPLIVEVSWPPGVVINDYTIDHQALTEYESLLEAAIARLPPESQDDFKALHHHSKREDLLGMSNTEYETILEAAGLPPMSRDELVAHFEASTNKLFGITRTNRYGFRKLNDGSEKEAEYSAVFKIASRINHSCMPNVLYYTKLSSLSMQFYAVRDIKAGEQLFSSYFDINTNVLQRRARLAVFGFICNCPACIHATPETDRLRETFINQIDRLKFAAMGKKNPSNQRTLLENALTLEKEMLQEGLDSEFKFGTLLQVICLAFSNLGKMAESQMYLSLVMEFRMSLKEDEE